MRYTVALFLLCGLTSRIALGDLTTVNFDSGNNGHANVFDHNTGASNPLFGGTTADGDGDVLQLGYYDQATLANPFAGVFVALSGEGSANNALVPSSPSGELYNQTSIGDIHSFGVDQNGTFAIGLNFGNNAANSHNLPAAGTPIAIRVFDGTTLLTSNFYNAVADPTNLQWVWKSPAAAPLNPVLNMSLDNAGLQWLSVALGQNVNTQFHTTISLAAVPEPSTWAAGALAASGILASIVRRRRN